MVQTANYGSSRSIFSFSTRTPKLHAINNIRCGVRSLPEWLNQRNRYLLVWEHHLQLKPSLELALKLKFAKVIRFRGGQEPASLEQNHPQSTGGADRNACVEHLAQEQHLLGILLRCETDVDPVVSRAK